MSDRQERGVPKLRTSEHSEGASPRRVRVVAERKEDVEERVLSDSPRFVRVFFDEDDDLEEVVRMIVDESRGTQL